MLHVNCTTRARSTLRNVVSVRSTTINNIRGTLQLTSKKLIGTTINDCVRVTTRNNPRILSNTSAIHTNLKLPLKLNTIQTNHFSSGSDKNKPFGITSSYDFLTQPVKIPKEVVVVPTKKPILPQGWFNLELGRAEHAQLLKKQAETVGYVGMFLATDEAVLDSRGAPFNSMSQLHTHGVLCLISNSVLNTFTIIALKRIKIVGTSPESKQNNMVAQIEPVEDEEADPNDKEIIALFSELQELHNALGNYQTLSSVAIPTPSIGAFHISKPSSLVDVAATRCQNASNQELLPLLSETNVKERLKYALLLVRKELELYEIKKNINKQLEESMNKTHRRFLLEQQLKHVKRELGIENDEKKALLDKFEKRLESLVVPEHAMKVIKDEMNKLSTLEATASEFNMTRTYLDWLTSIPWGKYSDDIFNLKLAKKVLDEDHYGLKELKERILEFIAVGKLKKSLQGKILCFVGPPGVGKTSIGKSIARALGRKFFRFSVGGLYDVSEIKGHRRTYIGSMPGKIIQCLKNAETSNPVVLIDEIDKLGRGHYGDPSAALLEVLDPSQNNGFLDHYLDVPVDVSKILFICTANVKDTIPGPLADRMEIINLSGYLQEEKVAIARDYLIPNARADCGLSENQVIITDDAINALIRDYCREAGVRNLQKKIEKIFRKAAFKIVSTRSKFNVVIVGEHNLIKYVGKPVFNSDRIYPVTPPGVVTGLAWTAMGGATLYVETVVDKSSTKAELKLTGQMGDVMKESTEIAYTYAKKFYSDISKLKFFETASLHMHIPEGATPKDGPSAGITMVTSLISIATDKPVHQDLAMTGELTLTGKVLPIGGVKEKSIAAIRSGMKYIIFPKHNQKDWEELPQNITSRLKPFFVENYNQVYQIAFKTKLTKYDSKVSNREESDHKPQIISPSDDVKDQEIEEKQDEQEKAHI